MMQMFYITLFQKAADWSSVETKNNLRLLTDSPVMMQELKELLEALDASHKELIANLDGSIADKLEQLKLETDTRFEDFRAMINDIAYQQRFSSGGSGNGYSLPAVQVQEIPADTRDLRVSPDASLDSILN